MEDAPRRATDPAGSVIFSDRGAWHGYAWGERSLLEAVDLLERKRYGLFALGKAVERGAFPDRMEARLENGARITVRFLNPRTAEIEASGGLKITAEPGPLELREVRPGLWHHVNPHGPATPGPDLSALPQTLRWNWREPLGDIRHGGCIPSPFAYVGFWAWDSWKHAAVLPAPLAREQIRAMFDWQRADGMVPDTVRADSSKNHWGCSKPPLAAWACSKHPGLLEEFRPAILRYLQWWEENRRPPGCRLFAYGGDDLERSRWESGWDNATRYDEAKLLPEGMQNVLSVDLNAFICREKRLLGDPDPELERLVNEVFFHDGAFYDVTWPDLRPVKTLTAAGWIPLWCGIATADRAESVIRLMLDPRHFYTPLPFPTVARSDARFDPEGYWRGPVWMDHACWAVETLARYGREKEAREAASKLLESPPDWECYHPFTSQPALGARPAVPQFGWTSAARWTLEKGFFSAKRI